MAGIRRLLAAAASVLLLLVPRFGEAADAVRGNTAPVIGSVRFQVASPYLISYEELSRLVAIRPGDTLTEEKVRNSIRGLYEKPIFKEIAAYVREEGGKADLLFYLRPSPSINEIEIAGNRKVPSAQILSASRIRRGAPLEDRDFREAEAAVKKALRMRGFTAASVSISAVCSLDSGAGKAKIDVGEGDPATVSALNLPGAASFPRERLLELLGTSPGDPFDFRKWEEGIKKLRVAYKKAGFLTVRISGEDFSCEGGEGLCPSVRIEEGRRYEVSWITSGKISIAKLEDASGIYGDEETSEGGLIHDVRERLLAFYREKDFLKADVNILVTEKADGARLLKVETREGVAGWLKKVRFEGNRNFPEKKLRKQMTTEERGFFAPITGSGKYREEEWNEDLEALIGLYQKEGFVRARITAVDNEWDGRGGITQTIRIEEGVRYRLREIRFRGNDHFLRQELLARIGNREGKFVDYVGLDRDQGAVEGHYRDSGYLDVRVETRLLFDEGKDTAAVQIDIEEGPRYRLGKVVIHGNLLTDPVVVLREVRIVEGAPAGEKDLLKFQQAVFGTGLYKSVRVQKVKRPSEGIVDLVVELEETLFFEVEFGGGYGSDSGARGFVGAKQKNLDGKGRMFSTNVTVSRKEQKYLWDVREPYILGNRWKWTGGLTGYHQEAIKRSFSLRKTSLTASINQTFFERSSVSLQYEVSRDHVFDVAPGAILSPEDQGSVNIAAVRGLFVLDLRDDPFNPRRGSFHSGSAEFASVFLGSEVDYYKLAGQTSWYFPVFRKNSFVLSGRAGYVRPLRETLQVPIQKRFFLGGRTTVRGFKEDSLGARATDGTPTGGDYMLNLNSEFRVPLQYGFNLAFFVDAGSVWFSGIPDAGFDLRESAGTGLRYITPIGPISLDYGWKLDRREGESRSEWHFTIGAVF
ncbi:MAG: outer membrane protein assembly factor BamA [Deltaproteobacteria bacterium]|nr:outer membrane protein assembly factor BamA [Deltaproteobacteria bacterium]